MAEALKEAVEQVIWDEQKNVSVCVRTLVCREMRYRIYPGVIWELKAWALSKAKEHRKKQSAFDDIILAVKKNLEDQDYHLSLQKLSKHHGGIAERYRTAAEACDD